MYLSVIKFYKFAIYIVIYYVLIFCIFFNKSQYFLVHVSKTNQTVTRTVFRNVSIELCTFSNYRHQCLFKYYGPRNMFEICLEIVGGSLYR